ncbi:hypothetical protein PV797_00520 [Clostridiaceae bacterium M8S5]|nr:hypothetical protein PV797_00520 [Clostridiaceae bacterium M8S5]
MKKFIIVLCVVCMMFSTMAFAHVQYWPEMKSGNANDTMDTAEGPYTLDKDSRSVIYIFGVASEADKTDFYKVKSSVSGRGDFWIAITEKGMNYDLFVYDKRGKLLGSSTKGGDEDERINHIYIDKDEIYYMQIKYISGPAPTRPYYLSFELIN